MNGLPAAWVALLASLAVAGCASGIPAHGPIVVPATAPGQAVVVHARQSAPTRIEIPAIRVNAPLVPLGLNPDKTVRVPDLNHVDQASWYCADYRDNDGAPSCAAGGVIPGNVGPAAIYGHIDGHRRDGVFKHLPELSPGDLVNIRRADQTVLTFKVYKVQQVHKRDFSTPAVYGDVQRPELRLITCTGAFVGGDLGYQDQEIVYASLA